MADEKFEIDEKAAADDKGGAGAVPAEIQGKTPAEIWAMVTAEREKAAELTKAKQRAEAMAQEVMLSALDRQTPTKQEAKPDAAPDREEDPEGFIAWSVKKQLNETLAPVIKSYTQDRHTVMGQAVEMAKQRTRAMFPDWDKHATQIEEFARNYSPDVLAQPNAYEEIYYRIKGRATAIADTEQRVREQASVETRGRTGVGSREDERQPATVDADQSRIAAGLGVDPAFYTVLEGSGKVSLDDYMTAKASVAKAKEKANAAR